MTVCPALLPPWLRTTMSARAVSTSMILPLPSSPHCAPIRIVFAIAAPFAAKKFSRRIRQDAIGTCRRMIGSRAIGARTFDRRKALQVSATPQALLLKPDIRAASGARSMGNEAPVIRHHHYSAHRRAADLALQHRLGLLSERRCRSDPADRDNPCAGRRDLMRSGCVSVAEPGWALRGRVSVARRLLLSMRRPNRSSRT